MSWEPVICTELQPCDRCDVQTLACELTTVEANGCRYVACDRCRYILSGNYSDFWNDYYGITDADFPDISCPECGRPEHSCSCGYCAHLELSESF